MPENDFVKYEMNYRQLGKIAAETLIKRSLSERPPAPSKFWTQRLQGLVLQYHRLRYMQLLKHYHPGQPGAYIMQSFSRLYTHRSGIPVNVCIFSYDEIYEAFNSSSPPPIMM